MVDIRTIRGKDKTDAFAKARVEYGGNFVILTSRDIKVGGFLGLGMKTEHELRIMLNNSIYDRKNNNSDENRSSYDEEDDGMHRSKLLSDRIEMKKHGTEAIDASEMADRIASISRRLKEDLKKRNANKVNTNTSPALDTPAFNNKEENAEELGFADEFSNKNDNTDISNTSAYTENNNTSFNINSANNLDRNNNNIERSSIERSNDNFTPLPNFNNSQYSNSAFSNSIFANMGNGMSADSAYTSNNTNNSFSPINNYSNFSSNSFMNSMNTNVHSNINNAVNNTYNNSQLNSSIDENVKRLVQEQIKDMVKEYLENSIPNINLNKNYNSNNINDRFNDNAYHQKTEYNDNAFNDEENDIQDSIDEIKEFREENNLTREPRDKKSSNRIRNYFENNMENDSEVNVADGMEESFNYLRNREFPEEILLDLREYLLTSSNARFFQSKDVILEEVEKYFSERLILSNGIDIGVKKKIIVFVGPTGVGKTTTIPKIAAQHMKSGKKVSFVTIDNYRIAAVDQLQRYASIMKVPFTSASTPEALRAEIRKMDNSSLLFIDTMGRSPKGAEDIVAMSKYFTTVGRFDMDIQLVMSSTAKYKDAVKILNAFKPTNYKGVILTKVDETDYLASSICAIIKKKLPITYITHGQGVPKDISTAKKYGYKLIEGLFGKI
ncbi:flagellar biosynthesis regulator FlhF [Brachyspira alvinipulli]|uniref:flagellar biosynthesis regulator FlhF n=1 Tax=Brachyspira alvinipulli TaxID=84379 RepID=UPI00047FC3EC|nr:flagellar biosynthesis regulator FlhF [Brachyspira alvinipulli]